MSLTRVLCIVGPTAVGKSAVAEEAALRLDGEIVSTDSMQVYRGMDIGTAKVPAEKRRCKLRMVDVADVGEDYSVARFQTDARRCVSVVRESGKVPILCGGTGLYLDAVIDEMSFPHGEVKSETREGLEEYARQNGSQALYELLRQRDPASAELIHPNNVRRVVRALEMLEEGVSYAAQHEGLRNRRQHYNARIWALTLPRDTLYERIGRRVDAMFEAGLEEEVRRLAELGIKGSATASKAIGYKEMLAYMNGECTLDEARELIKRNSRRYAKRQLSWIRRDGRATWMSMESMSAGEAARTICEDWRRGSQ